MSGHENESSTARARLGIPLAIAGILLLSPLIEACNRFLNRPDFVLPQDPMNEDSQPPYDLSQETKRIQGVVEKMTGGNEGIVTYNELLGVAAHAPLVFLGEPHFHDGDKVAAREILFSMLKANPDKPIIVTLGRALPQDFEALEWFTQNSNGLSDAEAMKTLLQTSSLGKNWEGMIDLRAPGGGPQEYAKFLLMLRKFHLHTVGLGTDVATQQITGQQTVLGEIANREQKSAEILLALEKLNPDAVIFGYMGRPHVARGSEQGEGVTTILERLHAKTPELAQRKVLSINSGDSSEALARLNPGLVETLSDAKTKPLLRNSVLAVRVPQFSSLTYEGRDGENYKYGHDFARSDFFLLRLVSL